MSAVDDLIAWLLKQIDEDERRARAVDRSPMLNVLVTVPRGWGKQSAADHVNTWMPPRVIAECDAKRQLVHLHAVRSGTGGDWDADPPAICNDDRDVHPCGTLRLLVQPYASPYAHREGFRKEWLQ